MREGVILKYVHTKVGGLGIDEANQKLQTLPEHFK